MQGGLLKSASAVAILAAAGLFGASPAKAADLGGDCCADLEERVAELEATTVRKGTRKVSLTLSGFVSHHVMYWNDGTQNDVYIGDGGAYGSRFRFVGSAKISPQLTAGFLYEFQANTSSIGSMNQLNGGSALSAAGGAVGNSTLAYAGCGASGGVTNSSIQATNSPGCPVIRDTTVWLKHAQLGMIKVGHGSTATDNLILIDLGGASGGSASTPDVALFAGGFLLRGSNGQLASSTGLTWGNSIRGHESFDTFRREHVLYETPTLMGFTAQAAIANDNFWDVALRYSGEFSGIRIAAGIGYSEDTNFNGGFQQLATPVSGVSPLTGALCQNVQGTALNTNGTTTVATITNGNCNVKSQDWKGSASVLHVPTGLYLTGAYGDRKLSGSSNPADSINTQYTGPKLTMMYLNGGISKNFFGIGNTIMFGEYSESKGSLAQATFLNMTGGTYCTVLNGVSTGAATGINNCNSKVTTWGLGIQQNIDAASMQVFLTYRNQSLDANGFLAANNNLNGFNGGVHDVQTVILGTKIDF